MLLLLLAAGCLAQDDENAFRQHQLGSRRVTEAIKKYTDSATKEFRKKNVAYPPHDIFLRAFKSQNELELWARSTENTEYRLIKTYRVCAISGKLGPKRAEGDRQVPEGCYFINEFNPESDYVLSLSLNYPNYSDKILGKLKPGGNIYIHGGCLTVGCLPMTDEGIKEIYSICLAARLNGSMSIPVHIYPTRLTNAGMAFLKREFQKDPQKLQFWSDLKGVFDYFERNHKLLPVMFTPEGRYVY